jgi:hypothetical protein
METTSSIPADAHETVNPSSLDIPTPAIVGAVAGLLVGKSLKWAAVGGVAGFAYARNGGSMGDYGVSLKQRAVVAPKKTAATAAPSAASASAAAAAKMTNVAPATTNYVPWALAAGAAYLLFW